MTTKNILIVNENHNDQEQIKQLLGDSANYQILGAHSGEKALEICGKNNIDCILLNPKLSDMAGLDLVVKLQEQDIHPELPVIITLGEDQEDLSHSFMKLGIRDYLRGSHFTTEYLSLLITSVIEQAKSIKQLQSQKDAMEKMAYVDHLTQLPNRLNFEKTLEREVAHAKRHEQMLALLFIDLDDFKNINDDFGHQVGDLLLQEVANILKNQLRTEDFIARLGGDEFAVVMTEIKDSHDAGIVAQKLLKALNDTLVIDGHTISISASIGIADFPASGEDPTTLLKNADIAMYMAKEAGRNNYKFYVVETNPKHGNRLKVENALRLALKNDELFMLYQPKFDLQKNEMEGMEALVRWESPELGLISPGDFIPIAEKTGLIVPIGEWVIQRACEEYAKFLQETGYHIGRLAINLSPKQLTQGNIARLILKAASSAKIPIERIEMELTETAIMGELSGEREKLQELQENGIQIAVDDFGTGYSSLSHLKHLPVNALKIDLTFVQGVKNANDSDAKIIKSIINLANNLGLDIVAEGVETELQRQFLLDNGCRQAQGYLFSKPVTMKALIERFLARKVNENIKR